MEILDIPIEDILEPEAPIRSVADDEKMGELVGSVGEVGLLQPLVVRPEGDKYRIVAGHRRYIALQAVGVETAPCNVVEVSKTEAAILSLEENLKREDVNPLDVAKFFQHLVANHGMTQDQIAEKIGYSGPRVNQILSLLKLDPETQEAVQVGQLKEATARQLGRVKDPAVRTYFRNIVIKDGASREVVRQWVDDHLRQEQGIEASSAPPGATAPPVMSKWEPPSCFICGRTQDMGGLVNVYICTWEKEGIERSMQQEGLDDTPAS